eukprot:scaffold8514_cov74-Skeletonema_marinoi.AAC.2
MEALMKHYKRGRVTKEDFAVALRAHQAAVDATKSPQREKVRIHAETRASLTLVASGGVEAIKTPAESFTWSSMDGFPSHSSAVLPVVESESSSASLGHDTSLEDLRECYAKGYVQKEDFAAALRAHQAAVDATKSLERDIAEAFYAENKEEK